MVVQTIARYKEGQKNFRQHIDEKLKRLRELATEIARNESEYLFTQKQIEEAEKRGKKTFDNTRFSISLKKKVSEND